MTRVSGHCKAMPRKFSLASWLHQMTRQHFLKSCASTNEIIHCSIGIESHCRISSSILFLALFIVHTSNSNMIWLLIFDASGLQTCRISAKVTPGVYGGTVYRVECCHWKMKGWVMTRRGRCSCFVAHPAVHVTILTVANPRKVSYVWYVCWCSTRCSKDFYYALPKGNLFAAVQDIVFWIVWCHVFWMFCNSLASRRALEIR